MLFRSNNRWYYLQADTVAHADAIDSAVLRLRMRGARGATTPVVVKAVTTDWSETGITWNTKPAPGVVVATGAVVGDVATWYEFDVAAHVAAERAAGRTVVGFVVQASQSSSALVSVASGESTNTADRPHLVIAS